MKSKTAHSLIVCLILVVSHLTSVTAVTDADLEALEKQIEQQEAEEIKQTDTELETLEKQLEQLETEEKKQAEAEAKRKAVEKRKTEAEAKRKAEEEKQLAEQEKQRREEEQKRIDEKKRKMEEARLAEIEKQRQAEEAERQRLAAEEARLKKEANENKAKELAGEMVDIPGGTFRMGDNSAAGRSDEKPVHTVTIKPFKMGKHEVTFGHWDACVSDGGCNSNSPEFREWGRGSRPVTSVSWDDAQSFVNWLNGKTGGGYRLPSEAEWEYAARAGTETQYHWGNDIGRNHANCGGCGSQRGGLKTEPVGSFPANEFGLHDMHGNVWEWIQDCWHDSYNGAPSGGSAWEGGDCSRRLTRGGSLDNGPVYVRSAYRGWLHATTRVYSTGFRLAQDK